MLDAKLSAATEHYARDGFLSPVTILTAEEAAHHRAQMETAEAKLGPDILLCMVISGMTGRPKATWSLRLSSGNGRWIAFTERPPAPRRPVLRKVRRQNCRGRAGFRLLLTVAFRLNFQRFAAVLAMNGIHFMPIQAASGTRVVDLFWPEYGLSQS